MKLTNLKTEDGVTERQLELTVAGNLVPGAVWTPEGARGGRPLILVGHGGGMHRLAPPVVGTARRYVTSLGYAVLAIDAPMHGARVAPADAERVGHAERDRVMRSGGIRGEALAVTMQRALAQIPEWQAALDAAQALEGVGADGPVGYSGVSMGAYLGIPFVAAEPRVKASVFALAGGQGDDHPLIQAARRITVPLEFAAQWDDGTVTRDESLALFDAFASREKTLHANPGRHAELPAFERSSWEAFFLRHFGPRPPL
ncbi:MAG: alpha/beta hydrolase [Myxococcota bacterium]